MTIGHIILILIDIGFIWGLAWMFRENHKLNKLTKEESYVLEKESIRKSSKRVSNGKF